MGAISFIEFQVARTAEEAFKMLCDDAVYLHGHDPYSGTIATTQLVESPVKRVADVFSDEALDLAHDYAIGQDYGTKWESRVIDCGRCDGERMWAFYGWAAC